MGLATCDGQWRIPSLSRERQILDPSSLILPSLRPEVLLVSVRLSGSERVSPSLYTRTQRPQSLASFTTISWIPLKYPHLASTQRNQEHQCSPFTLALQMTFSRWFLKAGSTSRRTSITFPVSQRPGTVHSSSVSPEIHTWPQWPQRVNRWVPFLWALGRGCISSCIKQDGKDYAVVMKIFKYQWHDSEGLLLTYTTCPTRADKGFYSLWLVKDAGQRSLLLYICFHNCWSRKRKHDKLCVGSLETTDITFAYILFAKQMIQYS